MNNPNHTLIECQICHKSFPVLGTHIKHIHNLTSKEYLKRFPNSKLTTKEFRQKVSSSMKSRFLQNPGLRKVVASRTFDFIENNSLKPLLSRDHKTARECLNNNLWKPSIILYGSLIEAILREKTKTDSFSDALDSALKEEIISETEFHQIHVVKNSRNFVHLHKELEKGVQVINEYWAKTLSDIYNALIRKFRGQDNYKV